MNIFILRMAEKMISNKNINLCNAKKENDTESAVAKNNNKTNPTKTIENIKKGQLDDSGNKITNVLVKYDEYAIYEIDDPDINNRLRIIIDGHTNESESKIKDRFNKVKIQYIKAKVLLGKSSNYGMMKQRIAHTLSTYLSSDQQNSGKEFLDLIQEITIEHEKLVTNRAMYLIPSFLFIFFTFSLIIFSIQDRQTNTPSWIILTSMLSASLGGGLSILINAKSLNFEEFQTKSHYVLIGLERSILALITGAIAFIVIKSGIISPSFTSNSYWNTMAILIFSGFSESFIPSILKKISDKNQ